MPEIIVVCEIALLLMCTDLSKHENDYRVTLCTETDQVIVARHNIWNVGLSRRLKETELRREVCCLLVFGQCVPTRGVGNGVGNGIPYIDVMRRIVTILHE